MNRRLMFVHAHPDDESSKGAATAARYVDEGAHVTLVTCTGGEAGEVLNPNVGPIADSEMAQVRAGELAAAVAVIGFTGTYHLGYRDSGYHEDPFEVPDGTFARVALDEAAGRLAGIIRLERPQVVVTYPENGGYPHPDHIMTYLITMRALEMAEDPSLSSLDSQVADEGNSGGSVGTAHEPWRVPKVYATGPFPGERLQRLLAAMEAIDPEAPFVEQARQRLQRGVGFAPHTRIRCEQWFDRRDAALRAHVTQIDPEGAWFAIPREVEREHYPYEAYVVLHSDVLIAADESDLFAGLDVA